MRKNLSYEYIRGLIEGEGCFSFSTIGTRDKFGIKKKIPAFTLGMSAQDEDLVNLVRDTLRLRNKVYYYEPRVRKDGYKRQGMAILAVRDIGQLKDIIVPLFYGKLKGHKGKQFITWLDEIGNNPNIPSSYKFIYKLHKLGYYHKIKKFD